MFGIFWIFVGIFVCIFDTFCDRFVLVGVLLVGFFDEPAELRLGKRLEPPDWFSIDFWGSSILTHQQ